MVEASFGTVPQGATQLTPFILLATALGLGLRHGIDWDHIAALVDISGANTARQSSKHPMYLCLCYALGHGSIVFILGLAAITFAATLPSWIDLVMERIVGLTLVFLAAYLFFAVYQALTTRGKFKPQSRLMLLSSLLKGWINKGKANQGITGSLPSGTTGPQVAAGGAFSIGVLHGLGAETGTQILLITAIGSSSSCDLSVAMCLRSFAV